MSCLVCLVLAAAVASAAASPHPARHTIASPTAWGMAGGYTKVALADMSRHGVRFILVEMRWAQAEPRPRVFDEGYLRSVRELVDQARRRG